MLPLSGGDGPCPEAIWEIPVKAGKIEIAMTHEDFRP